MKKEKIRIITIQHVEDEEEKILVDTEAEITGDENDYTIAYLETQGDMEGEITTVRVRDGHKITISRKNAVVSSLIILEKNLRHITHYSNSGVSFNMGMSCSELESDFTGGRLYFRYETDMDLVPMGEIEFEFIFRKTEV